MKRALDQFLQKHHSWIAAIEIKGSIRGSIMTVKAARRGWHVLQIGRPLVPSSCGTHAGQGRCRWRGRRGGCVGCYAGNAVVCCRNGALKQHFRGGLGGAVPAVHAAPAGTTLRGGGNAVQRINQT